MEPELSKWQQGHLGFRFAMKYKSLSFLPLGTGRTTEYFYASHTTDFGVCERQIIHLFRSQVFKVFSVFQEPYQGSVTVLDLVQKQGPGLQANAVTKRDLGALRARISIFTCERDVNDDGHRVNSGGLYVPQITPIISPIPPRSSYNVTDTLQPPSIGVDILSP